MNKSKFVIEGLGRKKALSGTIAVRGAKNAILKALAASILFEDEVEFKNVPEIEDVRRMRELLVGLKQNPELHRDIAERLRASIVLTGPVLARYGEVTFPFPGGCVLGERPIDLFLDGYRAMGAEIVENDGLFIIKGKLRGAHIFFPFVSVTATETLMLAATLAEGRTILENAAMEPEIDSLAGYLNTCGAHIDGAGTPTLKIEGGGILRANGRPYITPPDRIETGSFLILAALAGHDVKIVDCEPKHSAALLSLLARAGIKFEIGESSISLRQGLTLPQAVSVRTHEYPGFPTDLQATMAVFLTQAEGEATILETIFDGRFRYAEDLARMGADIEVLNPHKVRIRGPRALSAQELEGPDLRAGLAYILAATVAEGTSVVNNAYIIDRGYLAIEERLSKLGLNIKREQI